MLKEGDRAPDFDLETDAGTKLKLSSLRGRKVVVYFYPKDSTPGCTIEANDFSRLKASFDALGVTVLGVSRDSVKSHCSFRDKQGLTITLVSDPDLVAHQGFGAWGEKNMYGKKILGTIRSTFVVGADGRIERAWPTVKVAGHAEAVLAAVGGASGSPPKAASSKTSATPAKPAAKATVKAPAKEAPTTKARTAKAPAAAAKKASPKKPAAKKPAAKKPAAKKPSKKA
jgi:peroxiredoxin Q/BCP